MAIGPRLTYYPLGVLLTAPYDAQLTPAMVGELKRLISQHGRRDPPDPAHGGAPAGDRG